MSGLPGDENPNPQWQLPSQERPQWQSGSPLGDQAEQPPSQWQQQNPQWQASPPTSGKAIAALILGIVGVIFCPYVFSVLGLVVGYLARGEIKRSGGGLRGEGLALAGIIVSWAGLALWSLVLLSALSF